MIDLTAVADAPAWLVALTARPPRIEREAVEGFVEDTPVALDAARARMAWLIKSGDMPTFGNRDDHAFRTYSMLHGLGLSQDAAREHYEMLYDAGGVQPDNPTDLDNMIERIWAGVAGDNPPGSELPPIASDILGEAARAQIIKPRFRLIGIDEMLDSPPIDYWDADHMLPRVAGGYVGVVVGGYSAFKTQTVLAMTLATDARILFASGEGNSGLGARLNGLMLARGWDRAALRERFYRVDAPVVSDPAEIGAWLDWLAEIADEWRPDMVILDTFAAALGGYDELKAGALLTANGPVGRMASTLNALVLLVHHTGWSGQDDPKALLRSRGDSAIEGNADLVLTIQRDRKNSTVKVNRKKLRDGPDGPQFNTYYEVMQLAGVPVPQPINEREWALLTGSAKLFTPKKLRDTLLAMQAFTIAEGVTSLALVAQLFPQAEGHSPEDWHRNIERLIKILEDDAAALAGLNNAGRPLLWFAGAPEG